MKFKWTKEKPTKPGWYWMRKKYFNVFDTSIKKVRECGGELCIVNWAIPNEAEWAGPIPEPGEN